MKHIINIQKYIRTEFLFKITWQKNQPHNKYKNALWQPDPFPFVSNKFYDIVGDSAIELASYCAKKKYFKVEVLNGIEFEKYHYSAEVKIDSKLTAEVKK